ncbi:MAG TPA: ATP-binding cassette domain-containing protein [Byssovorax sp.]
MLEGVSRAFGPLVAVDDATVELAPGELHAIIGENGAGKSTLLKLAAGALAPTSGRVLVDGVALAGPGDALRRGVGLVYQHFMLCGAFTALENLVLGAEIVRGAIGALDARAARARAEATMERAGLRVPLDAITDALTVGERQRLEILRVLFRGARAVLLDEPTAVLSPLEADELYATLRKLADSGATVAVVTHRLDEVLRHADRVTAMRKGRVVLDVAGAEATADGLTRAVMGGEPPPAFHRPEIATAADVGLRARGLVIGGNTASGGGAAGIDLDVRAGEIVGVAGVEGNGQRELVRALAGLSDAPGEIEVFGARLDGQSVADRRARLGVVHEDRQEDGLVLDASVSDNLVLGEIGEVDERAAVRDRLRAFDVHPSDPDRLASELSGGNQQKIVLARALGRLGALTGSGGLRAALVLAQPTRGVDVGAAAAIHAAIGAAATRGLAVLVISADLAELRTLAHRLVVLHRGRIAGEFPVDADDATLGRAMLGAEAT